MAEPIALTDLAEIWLTDGLSVALGAQAVEPPPPPTPSQTFPPAVRDWWDSDQWGHIIPGNCVRR